MKYNLIHFEHFWLTARLFNLSTLKGVISLLQLGLSIKNNDSLKIIRPDRLILPLTVIKYGTIKLAAISCHHMWNI